MPSKIRSVVTGHDDHGKAIVPEDETVLKPGMIFVIHPCVMDVNGEGVFVGDSYPITQTGWERLNTTFSGMQR